MNSAVTVRAVLAYASFVLLAGAFFSIASGGISDVNSRDVVMVIVGAIISRSGDAFAFFFGTSQSSHEKTQTIASLADGPRDVHVTNTSGDPVPTIDEGDQT